MMAMHCTNILLLIYCKLTTGIGLPTKRYEELGDLNFGVLVPVHAYTDSGFCGRKVRDLGALQRVEAIAQV